MALTHKSQVGEKIRAFVDFARLGDANKKAEPNGLIPRIADALIGTGDAGVKPDVVSILHDLFAYSKLNLPLGQNSAGDFQPDFKTQASEVLSSILKAAGKPGLALISKEAIEILKSRIQPCVDPNATPVPGLPLGKGDGDPDLRVVLYFVERDAAGKPNLPLIEGSTDRMDTLDVLNRALKNWAKRLKLVVNMVDEQDQANMIVTSADLGQASTVLARTEIGPPDGRQLRMLFNVSKVLSENDFLSNTMHEFGHLLGIFHEDVDMDDSSLVMHGTLAGVTKLQTADLQAAVNRGWRLS